MKLSQTLSPRRLLMSPGRMGESAKTSQKNFAHIMATNYAVRISRSWEVVERAVVALALRCDKVLAYEHVGTATEKVHVHLMLVGVRVDTDTLKNDCKKNGLATLKGNADWTFKTKDKKYGEVTDSPKYICYMTKGIHDPKYNKGYSDEELAEAKKSWEPPSNRKLKGEHEYMAFELMVPKDLPNNPLSSVSAGNVTLEYVGFKKVRSLAVAFAMERCRIMSPACKNMISMLYRTYCFKHEIVMDPKFDTW